MTFEREARGYCRWIEQSASNDAEAFIAEGAARLANLLAEASTLPDVTPSDSDAAKRPNDEEVRSRIGDVQAVLGDLAAYSTTLEPYAGKAEEVAVGSLADDLVDIWRDLRAGLDALDGGAPPDDVVWEWRFAFYSHWGRHATEALRALHAVLADRGGPSKSSA